MRQIRTMREYPTSWSKMIQNRVAQLPQPYRLSFEDWLQQRLGLKQINPVELGSALEYLEAAPQNALVESIEAVLRATEENFGSR